MNMLSVALVALLAETAGAQPHVHLKVKVGEAGDGTLDQPALSWKGSTLHARAVTSMTATSEVEATAPPGITVADGTVTLCYHRRNITPPPGQMIPHWARPVLLDFTVQGLPKQDYKVSIAECP